MIHIKECFKSRFVSGYIVEADFSQLEVVALAYLSGCAALRSDILDGIDIHCANLAAARKATYASVHSAYVAGDPIVAKRRKLYKALGFQLQYGAGAKSMSETWGISLAEAKQFIKLYYDRYPGVQIWHQGLVSDVQLSRVPSGKHDHGVPVGVGYYMNPITGRRLKFHEKYTEWKGDVSFVIPQIKNYPVQSFATGDLVPLTLGLLYDTLAKNKMLYDVLPVNTIHDSIVLDVRNKSFLLDASIVLEDVMTRKTTEVFYNLFGVEFDLPLNIEITAGPNWFDQQPIEKYI